MLGVGSRDLLENVRVRNLSRQLRVFVAFINMVDVGAVLVREGGGSFKLPIMHARGVESLNNRMRDISNYTIRFSDEDWERAVSVYNEAQTQHELMHLPQPVVGNEEVAAIHRDVGAFIERAFAQNPWEEERG